MLTFEMCDVRCCSSVKGPLSLELQANVSCANHVL